MQKIKKHRGHKRIWKDIERWNQNSSTINMNWLLRQGRASVCIGIYPIEKFKINSSYAEPRGATRKLMIKSLINVYHQWHKQLEELDTPYYLKIWLYEPNLSDSQVVCSIGQLRDFYDNTFHKPDEKKRFPIEQYGSLSKELQGFKWDYALEEVILSTRDSPHREDYTSDKIFKTESISFQKQLQRKNARIISDKTQTYCAIPRGKVWIGGK